jgi:hypothetical protein
MAKRDVDSVDTASPTEQVPESIQLAERWRVAGMTLKERSPQVFAKLFELLVVARALNDDDEQNIPESYFMT